MIMRKLDKLILKSFFAPFILTFFLVVFILLLQFMLKYFDDILGKDLGFGVFMEFMFYFSIRITPEAFPLALLLSSLMTFGNLGEQNELTAIKSSGISLIRTLFPLFFVSIIISLLAFYSNNYIIPKANLKALSLLYDIKRKKPSMDLKEGQFYDGIPGYSIKIDEKVNDKILKNIIIYDHISFPGNNRVILADSCHMYPFSNDRYLAFELFNGSSYTEIPRSNNFISRRINQFYRTNFKKMKMVFDMSSFNLNRTKEELFSGDYRMKNISQLNRTIDSLNYLKDKQKYILLKNSTPFYKFHMKDKFILSDRIKLVRSELREEDLVFDYYSKDSIKSLNNLFYNIDSIFLDLDSALIFSNSLDNARSLKTNLSINSVKIKSQDFEINKNSIEMYRKYAQAFACLTMFLIGAPLGSLIKKGGLGIPVIISIFFYLLYYFLNILSLKWAREGILLPEYAAWVSNFVLFPIGFFFLYKSSKDSRLIDFDFYLTYYNKFFKKFKRT